MIQKKAVICDDDKTTTMIVKHLLTQQGLAVRVANQGKEGLLFIEADKPDLLILDLDMPIKNGVSVLEDLRSKGIGGLYVIVMSSHESSVDHDKVKSLGAHEVIVKPFKPADLVQRVAQLMKEGRF